MRVCCTRPRLPGEMIGVDWPHINEVSEELLQEDDDDAGQQRLILTCTVCGMPLIIEDRYVPIEYIGEGGFGCTFLTINFKFGNVKRVLKQFHSRQFLFAAQVAQAKRRFQQEALVLESLQHPRIPRIYGIVTTWANTDSRIASRADRSENRSGYLYLAQSYIEGEDLQKELDKRSKTGETFSEPEVRIILQQVLETLHYIHTCQPQYIHRDISPSNLIATYHQEQRQYHLIDFGAVSIAKEIETIEGVPSSESRVYKVGFSPPEQLSGKRTAPCSDLYALAASCVSLLTGLRPDHLQIPYNLTMWSTTRVVSPDLVKLFNKLLQPEMGDRYQSAQEVLDILNAFPPLTNASSKTPVFPTINVAQLRSQRWLIPAAGAIVALFALSQLPIVRCTIANNCSAPSIPAVTATNVRAESAIASIANVPTGKVRYGGSTSWAKMRAAALPIIGQSFPNFKLDYQDPPNSRPYSEAGIDMLINGQLDVALSSKGIKQEALDKAEKKGIQLKEILVAINARSFAVHPSLTIEGLTVDQVEKIKAGTITNWKEVGGADLTIQTYSSGEQYLAGAKFIRVSNATEGLRRVAQDPGGILETSASNSIPQCGVKVLSIGSSSTQFVSLYELPPIPPGQCSEQNRNRVNVNNIRSGAYPIVEMMSVVIAEDGGFKQQAGEAYAKMLMTAEGQKLINEAGYLEYSLKQRFSSGDRILVEEAKSPQKLLGTQAFARQEYSIAVNSFTESLIQNENDPEALIYLNNAKLKAENRQTYRIAVSVPIGTKPNIAQEILRGIAQAQKEINQQGIVSGIGLEVEVVDDRNDPAIARQVAEELANDSSILAVVGHNTGDVAKAAAEIYQAKGLLLISPTTFDSRVAAVGNYIFRAVATSQTMSRALVDYVQSQIPQPKILICSDSSAPDQNLYRNEFVDGLTSKGGKAITLTNDQDQDLCDYTESSFNAEAVVQQAIAQGANGIFVGSNVNNFQTTANLINANNRRLPLFGNATLYTKEILDKTNPSVVEGLVLVAPWSADRYPAFNQQAQVLWGATVNWRTATSYDAIRAVIAGLTKANSRNGIRDVLSDRGFSTTGSGDPVRFLESRDRILTPVLVQVKNGRFEAVKGN
jgi:branched-chain amino acid transport system substrate-binding protein